MGTLSANFGASDAYTITLTWSEQSRDTAKNQTVLAFTCQIQSNRASATFIGGARTDSLTVGGRTFACSHGDYVVPGGGSVLLWSDTVAVTHDDDGTYEDKAVGFSVMIDTTFSATGWIGAVEAAGTMSLTAIPRASTLSFGAFTAGAAASIAIAAASADFTHDLYIDFGSDRRCIAYDVRGPVSWTPPLELLSQIPDATAGTGVMTCYTFLNRGLVGTTEQAFTLYVPDTVRPVLTAFSAEIVNDNAVADGWGLALRTLTKLRWTAEAAGSWGSTVRHIAFSAGGVSGSGASGTTAVLPNAGSVTPSLTVTDSRGRTASMALDPIEVVDYSAPTLGTAAARRCTEDGSLSTQGGCCLLNLTAGCSPVEGRNSVSLRYRMKPVSGSFSGWLGMTDGQILTGFAPDTSYIVELSAVDTVGSGRSVQVTVPAASAAFHVRDGGRGAAFGKYAEEDNLLDIAWNLCVRGELDSGTKSRLFDTSYSLTARTYPTAAGIYWVPGVNVFSNMTPDSPYGILIIFHSVYSLHLYLDAYGFLYYGYSSEDFQEPAKWWYVSRNEQT